MHGRTKKLVVSLAVLGAIVLGSLLVVGGTGGVQETAPANPHGRHVHSLGATPQGSFFGDLLKTYTPRQVCMFYETPVIWLHVLGDALTALAYYSIPFALVYFVRRRRDLAFSWMFWLFAAFILACGTTHLFGVIDIWRPFYRVDGLIKVVTGILSLGTAVALWPLIPHALALPSSAQLAGMVAERTAELAKTNEALRSALGTAQQARAAAEQANQAKDQFLAVLSHELRTPLTPVLATVAMLQQDSRFDADTRESLEMIRRNVELEARIIDDLLDVARIAHGKVELEKRPIELCTVLRRAAEVCRADIEVRSLQFGIDAPDRPYIVDADVSRLQQVFWNLLKNAVRFTPPGGCVGIRCRRDGQEHVIVEVNDSGEGIAPELLPRLFTPFEQGGRQTIRQFGGLGLGLAISKALVERHGGTISAHSEGEGKGATFRVRLPMISGPVATKPQSVIGTPGTNVSRPRSLRILLVEDHGDTARIMKRLLVSEGHQVQTAADVATAMQLADQGRFDLLLSDLGLPDGNGWDLLQSLRQRGVSLPAIALSGFGREEDLQRSRQAGFTEHLTKPVDLERLAAAIDRI